MVTRLYSAAVSGIDGFEVQVEVDAVKSGENGRMTVVGLPDTAVRESTERVISALLNSRFFRPAEMVVTVNLAPADVKKQGPGFDLPIAIGLEMAIQENYPRIPKAFARDCPQNLADWCLVGELALDGMVRGVRGVLPLAVAAREAGRRFLMVSPENADEASVVEGLEVYAVETLSQAWEVLLNPHDVEPYQRESVARHAELLLYYDEVKGNRMLAARWRLLRLEGTIC